jgi:hypothetical protein
MSEMTEHIQQKDYMENCCRCGLEVTAKNVGWIYVGGRSRVFWCKRCSGILRIGQETEKVSNRVTIPDFYETERAGSGKKEAVLPLAVRHIIDSVEQGTGTEIDINNRSKSSAKRESGTPKAPKPRNKGILSARYAAAR